MHALQIAARGAPAAVRPRLRRQRQRAAVSTRAASDEPGSEDAAPSGNDDDTASAFKRELKRRGITAAQTEQLEQAAAKAGEAANTAPARPPRPAVPPRWASDTPESLAPSRALGAEGLEGLILRATQLIRLGFGFFLPFWPFMAVFSLLFTLTYVLFGKDFLHDGGYFDKTLLEQEAQTTGAQERPSARGPPAYVVPEALLAEPTVDRMVPFTKSQ